MQWLYHIGYVCTKLWKLFMMGLDRQTKPKNVSGTINANIKTIAFEFQQLKYFECETNEKPTFRFCACHKIELLCRFMFIDGSVPFFFSLSFVFPNNFRSMKSSKYVYYFLPCTFWNLIKWSKYFSIANISVRLPGVKERSSS